MAREAPPICEQIYLSKIGRWFITWVQWTWRTVVRTGPAGQERPVTIRVDVWSTPESSLMSDRRTAQKRLSTKAFSQLGIKV